jgi:simple sugar transport system ATP-binding protein
VTVLRGGRVVATVATRETSESKLAGLMVGREVLPAVSKKPCQPGRPSLEVRHLEAPGDQGLPALRGVSFQVAEGEIVGLAGVSGNGQRELAEVVCGLRKAKAGQVCIRGADVTRATPAERIRAGLAYVPEERKRVASIAEFSIAENAILETHQSLFSRWGLLDRGAIAAYVDRLIEDYDVRTPDARNQARTLSGGNLQKLILGRELSRSPRTLVAAQPTRGLDVGATEYVHRRLLEARERGTGILMISEDLDEVIALSDRILVMYEGRIVGEMSAAEADVAALGLLMGGARA